MSRKSVYIKIRKILFLRILFPPVLTLVGVLVIWETICHSFNVPEYLFPAPTIIYYTFFHNINSLLTDTAVTLYEALVGFIIANIVSIITAVGFCHSKILERSLYPYAIAIKSIPVIAIAPLLVLWFGYGIFGKILMSAIISFFPLVVNATVGLKSVDPDAIDLMRSLSASKRQILFKLRFPNALPYIFSALKISSTLSVVGAIVGEMTGAQKGIGFVILTSTYNIDTPLLFSAIIAASIGGILFFGLIVIIEQYVNNKYGFKNSSKEV